MGAGVRAAALILAGLWVVACDGPPRAEAARTPFAQLVADSAAADAAAFEALPASLVQWLDVRPLLDPASWETLPLAACHNLAPYEDGLNRRRLQLRLLDTTTVLLYAVADRSDGRLSRVEFIRRTPRQGQRGLVWDSGRDRTQSTWWNETRYGLSRRVERGEIPRGGPIPRAMRALGRQLYMLDCDEDLESAAAVRSPG